MSEQEAKEAAKDVGGGAGREPRLERWLEHAAVGMAFGVLFFFLLGISYRDFVPFIVTVFISCQLPDLDYRLNLGHRNPIMHSFVLPLALSVVFPRNAYVTGFFVGYAAHLLADLDNPRQAWVLFKKRTGVLLLWVSLIITLMLVFNVDLGQALKALFG